MLDGVPVEMQALEERLRSGRGDGGATILVEADEDVPFAQVRAVAHVCERAGYGTVLFSVASDAEANADAGN